MKKQELKRLITETRRLILAYKKHNISIPILVGKLGELEVYNRIFSKVDEYKGGLSRVDIKLKNGKGIEVKSASYDKDYSGAGGLFPEKYDYFIFVSFNKDYSKPKFFIFTKEETRRLPTEKEAHKGETTRYNKKKGRCFHYYTGKKLKCKKMLMINKNIKKYLNAWDKIK
jgi:hypothetical protein